jgi:PAS domain S-box-containing protein
MVLDELCARGLPGASDDFPWPLLLHDGSRILHANPACLRWFGYRDDGALSQQPLSLLAAADDERSLIAALGADALVPPKAPHIQRFCSAAGRLLLGRLLARREHVRETDVTVALIAPVVEHERSFEVSRLLGAAVDHLTDIVFITEAHAIDGVGRRIVFVNRAFTESSGYGASEVLGKTPNITVGAGTDRKVLARIEAALAQTLPVCEDLLKFGKDGSPYWVELQILPMFDEDGQHSHWLSIQRDISERKRMEGRLMEAARVASAGQLSASLANEFNNPLASVKSSLEWLAERLPGLLAPHGPSSSAAREALEALADARLGAARIASATSYLQLLGTSSPPSHQTLTLAPLVDEAAGNAAAQLAQSLDVENTIDPELAAIADPARLSHALRLSILNAALACNRKIRCDALLVDNRVHLGIEDDGAGVAAELTGIVKAPFEARKPPGMGDALGLFVASRLVAELGGELLLVPRPRGTRVELRLPRG